MRLYGHASEGAYPAAIVERTSHGFRVTLINGRHRFVGVDVRSPFRGVYQARLCVQPKWERCVCGVGRRPADRRRDEQCAVCTLDLRPDGWWLNHGRAGSHARLAEANDSHIHIRVTP